MRSLMLAAALACLGSTPGHAALVDIPPADTRADMKLSEGYFDSWLGAAGQVFDTGEEAYWLDSVTLWVAPFQQNRNTADSRFRASLWRWSPAGSGVEAPTGEALLSQESASIANPLLPSSGALPRHALTFSAGMRLDAHARYAVVLEMAQDGRADAAYLLTGVNDTRTETLPGYAVRLTHRAYDPLPEHAGGARDLTAVGWNVQPDLNVAMTLAGAPVLAVPEPGVVSLMLAGLALTSLLRRRT